MSGIMNMHTLHVVSEMRTLYTGCSTLPVLYEDGDMQVWGVMQV